MKLNDTTRALINAAFKKHQDKICELADRWRDESQFENFADYAKLLKKMVPETGTFIKASKRPFGFFFSIDCDAFFIGVKNNSYLWQPEPRMPVMVADSTEKTQPKKGNEMKTATTKTTTEVSTTAQKGKIMNAQANTIPSVELSQKEIVTTATMAQLVAFYNAKTGKAVKKFSTHDDGMKKCLAILDAEAAKKAEEKKPEAAPTAKKSKTLNPADFLSEKGKAEAAKVAGKAVTPAAKKTQTAKPAKSELATLVGAAVGAEPEAKTKKPTKAELIAAHKEKGSCPLCGADPAQQTAAGEEGTTAGDERAVCHSCGVEYWWGKGTKYNPPKTNEQRAASISATWEDEEVRAARSARHSVNVDGKDYKSIAVAFKELGLPAKYVKFRVQLVAAGKGTYPRADGKGDHHFKLIPIIHVEKEEKAEVKPAVEKKTAAKKEEAKPAAKAEEKKPATKKAAAKK